MVALDYFYNQYNYLRTAVEETLKKLFFCPFVKCRLSWVIPSTKKKFNTRCKISTLKSFSRNFICLISFWKNFFVFFSHGTKKKYPELYMTLLCLLSKCDGILIYVFLNFFSWNWFHEKCQKFNVISLFEFRILRFWIFSWNWFHEKCQKM